MSSEYMRLVERRRSSARRQARIRGHPEGMASVVVTANKIAMTVVEILYDDDHKVCSAHSNGEVPPPRIVPSSINMRSWSNFCVTGKASASIR
jgi:hypothetical protein